MTGKSGWIRVRTGAAAFAVLAASLGAAPTAAQTPEQPPPGGTEVGNFGDVPFQSRQILLTRPEDRTAWRALEDKHLGERRALEDRVARMMLDLIQQQSNERDEFLRTRSR